MLITFKSKASADITMYKKHVLELFTVLDKNVDQGVITAQEIDDVIKKIEQYIIDHQVKDEENNDIDENDIDDYEKFKIRQEVSLSARLFPLLEMLKAANQKQKDILWGV